MIIGFGSHQMYRVAPMQRLENSETAFAYSHAVAFHQSYQTILHELGHPKQYHLSVV
jgi:hypothetical protein